jgi:hypothetical protein
MTAIHELFGIAAAAAIVFLVVWAVIAKLALRPPGVLFERAARATAGLLGLQGLFGLILLAIGHRRTGLHYVYGIAALVAMVAGVALARALQRDRWVVLAWTAVATGLLVLRAMMTGFNKAA